MKTRALMVLAALAIVLTSCTIGSREVVVEERELGAFDEIVLSSVGELSIDQGSRESLTIEAESNVLRRIRSEVRGGVLYIEMRTSFPWFWGVVPTRPIRYDLTVKDLRALDLSGAGSVYGGPLETSRLSVEINGAGTVLFRQLSADELRIRHNGVGQCEISGRVQEQDVEISGAGEYDGGDLESEIAEVSISGLGKATVWALEALDVEISGAGSLEYYGDPRVTERISGLGNVRSRGDR